MTSLQHLLPFKDSRHAHRIVARMFNEAKRKHEQSFAESGKAINEKLRLYAQVGHALIDARQKGLDPYEAIEAVVAWDSFTRSVDEAERLARPESFDHLHLLTEAYLIIAFHQYWSSVAAVLITLFGWILALRGLVLMAAPKLYERAVASGSDFALQTPTLTADCAITD